MLAFFGPRFWIFTNVNPAILVLPDCLNNLHAFPPKVMQTLRRVYSQILHVNRKIKVCVMGFQMVFGRKPRKSYKRQGQAPVLVEKLPSICLLEMINCFDKVLIFFFIF